MRVRASSPPVRPAARHRVREGLKQMILSGQRRAGSKLQQQELADHFGVAPLVVREALLELKAIGLVETIDNRGVFVSEINKQKLLEAYDVREALEGMGVRLCCERVTRAHVRELREIAEQIFASASANELDKSGALDRALHERLMHLAGNTMLDRVADQYRWVGKIVRAYRDPAATRQEHLDIISAIDQNNPDEAERLMRRHIRVGKEIVEKHFEDPSLGWQWVNFSQPPSLPEET